jgi:hypothetical protein
MTQNMVKTYPNEVFYSDMYEDEHYEYRHVIITKPMFEEMVKNRLLTTEEWFELGI